MKAITIWQPWASLIVLGRKLVENRRKPHPWRSAVGQRIAIHAGVNKRGIDFVGRYGIEQLPFGAIVGYATLAAVIDYSNLKSGRCQQRFAHLAEHEHTEGPYCLVMEDAEVCEPVPAIGRQGLWTWDPERKEPSVATGTMF